MGKKIAFLVALVVLTIVAGTSIAYFAFPPSKTTNSVTTTSAVKLSMPVDLSGKWESAIDKVGTKMFAKIENNTIYIEMSVNDGSAGLWYGTFDVLAPGKNSIDSTFIDDPDHFVLSSAESKEFIYQGGSLVFDYSSMGIRTTVEMKRV